jgi:hypothetical protein
MDLEQIREVVDDRLRGVNTCMPGTISRYDASTREAEVTPQIDDMYADGERLQLPILTGVPVVQMATASAGLVLPIAAGDRVLVLFAQRSLDRWLSTGSRDVSGDVRMHAMSDAIAIAGLMPFSVSHSDGDGVRLHNDSGVVRIESGVANTATLKTQSDGKIALGTPLVELLDEVTKALDDIATGLLTIPYTPTITQAASAAIKTIQGTI